MDAPVLSIDFETAALSDLRAVGADVYARDPSLVVTVVAWAFDDDPVQSAACPQGLPEPIRTHLKSGGKFRAWNAAFESVILTHHYRLDLKPGQASCTMQRALYSGLPAALLDAGRALGVNVVKDPTARRLMLRMARPRAILPDGSATWWHSTDAKKLDALSAYCRRDVESEREISAHIRELPGVELEVSRMDSEANARGVQLDADLVRRLKRLAQSEIQKLDQECAALTNGAVTAPGSQTARLVQWFSAHGLAIADLSKETVAAKLIEFNRCWDAPTTVKRVLEIRQEIAKSSIKKLDAMLRCAGPDGRVRGQLAYYGAFRTGRFAGRLIQPQNFPRPTIKLIKLAVQAVQRGADPEFLRLIWANPLDVVANLLRSCLIPGPGKAFVVYDLSQIEARVVAWLAGQTDVLDVFARGDDVYVWTAARLGSSNRQFGKVLVLACGFGMGPGRFQATALTYGLNLALAACELAVQGWRDANPFIVDLWWRTDRIVREALTEFSRRKRPVTKAINDKLSVTVSLSRFGQTLMTARLPSGRRLYYRNARLEPDARSWSGEAIVYDGVHQATRQWTAIRTYGAKFVENFTQAVARDVIVEAALRVDGLKLGELVLSVHDELVFELDGALAGRRAPLVKAEIDRRPPWGLGLPVASEGGVVMRYGK